MSFLILVCQFAFVLDNTVFAQDRIYTDEDLKVYYTGGESSSIQPLIKTSDYNPSFDEMHKYIEEKLKNVRIPEWRIYLRPLSRGMTQQHVERLWWGSRRLGGSHVENDRKSWFIDIENYEIGISLYYANDQLKGWKIYEQPHSIDIEPAHVIEYEDLLKKSHAGEMTTNEHMQKLKEYRGLKEDEQVKVSVRGCQTLQEALDRKTGNTKAVISVTRHWRTIKEICDSVGQGCKACEEVTH